MHPQEEPHWQSLHLQSAPHLQPEAQHDLQEQDDPHWQSVHLQPELQQELHWQFSHLQSVHLQPENNQLKFNECNECIGIVYFIVKYLVAYLAWCSLL